MKRVLLLMSILMLGMNFVYGKTISSADNSIQTQEYQSALKLFKAKEYKKALPLLSKLVDKYPQNEKINFYYGRTAFELKKYEFAFTAYDRILISNPTNQRVRLEYGRTLFMMGSYKEAKKEFETVLASPIPPNVRKNVEKFLAMVKAKEKNYILNKVIVIGLGWDDNVNNSTYEYNNNVFPISTNNNTNKKSDTNLKTILVGNLIVPYKANKHITWETTGVLYLQKQRDTHANNILLKSLTSGIGYTNKRYKNLTSLIYNDIDVGEKHTLRIYGVSDNYKYNIYKKHLLTMKVEYKKKKWVQKVNTARDSTIKGLSLNYMIPIKATKDKFNLFTSYTTEKKEKGTRPDVSKDTKQYKVSYTKKILKKYDLSFAYLLEKNRYKDAIRSTVAPRDDKTKTATIGVTRAIDATKTVSFEYNHIKNDSNNNAYAYKKQSVNISYTLLF